MRIYQVNVEHKKYGRNYDRFNVSAKDFEEAVKTAKSRLTAKNEKIESMELIAEAD